MRASHASPTRERGNPSFFPEGQAGRTSIFRGRTAASRGTWIVSTPLRYSAESMNVSFEDGVLSVHAKVPQRSLPGRQLVQEYGIGDYRRSFRLGEGFDASQISAEYR